MNKFVLLVGLKRRKLRGRNVKFTRTNETILKFRKWDNNAAWGKTNEGIKCEKKNG